MECKNKEFKVKGLQNSLLGMRDVDLHSIVTNDKVGKTLSVNNGTIQFIIPMDEIAKYLQ